MWNRPAATAEPVLPPVTHASQSPFETAIAAWTIEASGAPRTALAGSAALAIDTGASTTSTPSETSPIASAGPNSTGVTPCAAAIAAPAATSAGPRSAPLASTAMRTARYLVVVLVAELGSHDLAAAIGPAHRADAVRTARAVALRAAVERRRVELVLRAALVRTAVRLLLLRDGHEQRGRLARRVGPQAREHDLQVALPADRRWAVVLRRRRPREAAHQAGDVVHREVGAHGALRLRVGDEPAGELREARLLGRGVAEVGVLVHRFGDGAVLVDDPRAVPQQLAEPVPRVRILERLARRLGEAGEALVGKGTQQTLPAREVAIDGAHADAGRARDLVHADVEPMLGELLARGHEHELAIAAGVGALCGDGHGGLQAEL